MNSDPLAKLLVERQLISQKDADKWLGQAQSEKCCLEAMFIREKVFAREELVKILENHYFCPSVDLRELEYAPAMLARIPRKLAVRHLAFPVRADGEKIVVAFADPDNVRALDSIRYMTHQAVTPAVALRHEILDAIERHYNVQEQQLESAESLLREKAQAAVAAKQKEDMANRASIFSLRPDEPIKIIERIFENAVARAVTDIHLEPGETGMTVRFRIDGIMHAVSQLPREIMPAVVSRVKVIGEMDIAERRLPQDGRYSFKRGDQVIDVRISTLPSQFGEKAVMRLLVKNMSLLSLDNLQMPPAVRKAYQEAIDKPQGFFLVTGPTGSGKTTTLYATLNSLDREAINIVTLEDPIEYSLPIVTQVQIHEDAGLTFAEGLRSILRQDPDVILVGEIRDLDTVTVACRAALTGHKVFSTLHTNDAAQTVIRLLDMGVTPYLITAALRGVLGQRLVRLLCPKCKQPYEANETELALLGHPKNKMLYRGEGCPECSGTGYRGRVAMYEYLHMDENIHRLVIDRASAYALRHAAQRNGMVTMAEFAKKAAQDGLTTVGEIQRAILADEGQEQLCQNCKRVVSSEFAVCPFCQHILKERCPHCSHPVEASWEACPSCGRTIERESQAVYCPNCLAPAQAHWRTCPYCGGAIQ